MTQAGRAPAAGFNLSPGQTRFGPAGQPIASLPAAPEKPTARQRAMIQDPKDRTKPLFANYDPTDGKFYDTGGKEIKDAKPFITRTQTGEPTVVINTVDEKGNPVIRVMPRSQAQGRDFPAAPTADMRNKAVARGLVARSISAIKELSQKVITKRGIAQRATAAGRSVEAAMGNDPEYRTYQDARMALAGNLAVGQQGSRPSDADIRAIWLPLIPDVFRDTDESAAMKWDLIGTMSNTGEQGSADPLGIR